MPAKAASTPATANSPTLTPAFFAERPTSALASSISARMSVDTSAMALCTSDPTEGSSLLPACRPVGWVDDALWATGGSSLVGLVGQPLETACGCAAPRNNGR